MLPILHQVLAGVIGVETQTVMMNIPADPGMPDSTERTIPQVHPAPLPLDRVCLGALALDPAKYIASLTAVSNGTDVLASIL